MPPYFVLVNLFCVILVNLGCVSSAANTLYFGPSPKPAPGEHWMQTAVTEIRKRCPRKRIAQKDATNPCPLGEPLGIEDGRIPDANLTASSSFENKTDQGPTRARLNTKGWAAAWHAAQGDVNPWIQVDFGSSQVYMTGLITQGRDKFSDLCDCNQWVTEYQVKYGNDVQSLNRVTDENGTPTTFTGNNDWNTYANTTFETTLHARYLRILPTACNNDKCSMRFEVLGCRLD